MIDKKCFEYLEKELDESFAYTLHDKLIFISGILSNDDEYLDLLDFVNYLLYTEKENISFPVLPKLDIDLTKGSLYAEQLKEKIN